MTSDTPDPWVTDDNASLLTDQYELTMARAYLAEGMTEPATFSLFVRRLPDERNYLLAAGLDSALNYLESLSFSDDELEYLASLEAFDREFVAELAELEFTGDVRAVPEGTPVFPDEPLVEVTAPLPEAQIAESFVMNQVHLQTVLASKASRVARAAGEKAVVDFGLRRMHGTDAAMRAARAFHIAGVDATSNVLAGRAWDVTVTGTMAHSYIQSHDSELEAFRAFSEQYPETILLVDTYDTLEGVDRVVQLAEERGEEFRIGGIRLDSGDLGALARTSRRKLDRAGLQDVDIFASGGLDEYEIRYLRMSDAPIDGFGVGTAMGTARDAPGLDIAYKLTEYAGEGRLKLSPGKKILPGPKQVYRRMEDGIATGDTITLEDGDSEGEPLLETVMVDGDRVDTDQADLEAARQRANRRTGDLPERVQSIEPAEPTYPVEPSRPLVRYQQEVADRIRRETETGE
ncbi:MAG: nicotinate phosphoribosyltransferase [Bradymonadaceae bacterium]